MVLAVLGIGRGWLRPAGQVGAIADPGLDAGQAQALQVAADPLQAGGAAVEGHHLAPVAHQLGQVGALAAGGGAGIEDPLARLGIEQGGDALGGAVLHAPAAFGVAGQLAQVPAAAPQHQALGQAGQGLGRHAGGPQVGQELVAAAPQGVAAQIEGRGLVASHRKGFGLGGRQPGQQGLGQPVRQRLALGQGQGRIGG